MTPALDELITAYGLLAEAVRYPADFVVRRLPPARRGPLARREPVTPGGRDLLLQNPEGEQPDATPFYYQNVDRGRADRPARGDLHVLGEEQPRIAADRWARSRSCPSIGGGHGPDGRKRDVTETTLELPLGSGPYRLQEFEAGRTADLRARRRLLGPRPQRECGPQQLRRDPLRIFPRLDGAARSLQGRPLRFPGREHRPQLGDRLRLSRPCRRAASSRRNSRSRSPASCRPSSSTCAGTSSRTSGCGAPSTSPSISRR